ncbi:MAG: HAMP domain-containing protein, partial [Verrucomicrobiota bacterium]
GSVDAAWKSLNDFAGALGRNLRKEPNLALAVRMARRHLDDGLGAIDRYLEREPGSFRRPDFEAQRRQIVAFKAELDGLATVLGSPETGSDDKVWADFESRFANLTRGINRMRRPLRGESAQIAQRLAEDEDNALEIVLAVGALGLVVAALAAGFMWRTLKPLHVLRARAREIAGGEYGRRTGVRSRDEIGDLAPLGLEVGPPKAARFAFEVPIDGTQAIVQMPARHADRQRQVGFLAQVAAQRTGEIVQ